jgi:hypothetical protein
MKEKQVKLPSPVSPFSIHRNPARVVVSVAGRVVADIPMPTTVRGIKITRTSSSKPIAFSPGTSQPRKPVSGLNQQANKSLRAGSDSELARETFQGEIQWIPKLS